MTNHFRAKRPINAISYRGWVWIALVLIMGGTWTAALWLAWR